VDVRLAMQVRPSSKELHQRLDQLRSRGCCQYVFSFLFSTPLLSSRFDSPT
jgi:hypothetical protein